MPWYDKKNLLNTLKHIKKEGQAVEEEMNGLQNVQDGSQCEQF